jgi:hypothetical protein
MNSSRHDRRSLLRAGGSGLALLAAPGWIQVAFARQDARSKEPGKAGEPETIAHALERATSIGKPLMVIVVPAEDLRLERGRLWGDLFAFAPEAAMADFALCEWICAPAADLVRSFPQIHGELGRETVAILIETEREPKKTRLAAFRLGDLGAQEMGGFPVTEMTERAGELARLLQELILPDRNAWERRWEQSRSSRTPGNGDDLLIEEDGARPRLRAVDRQAATVRANAELWPHRRAHLISSLAQAASLRLWDGELAGASWKTEFVDPCPPCGMGRINGASRAFLEFYVSKDR